MIEDLNKWIVNSIFDHFVTGLTGQYTWCQGLPRSKEESNQRYEVRLLGPDVGENGSEYMVRVRVNIAVRTEQETSNPHKHPVRVGNIFPLFSCILIKKVGDQPTDTQDTIGILQRMDDITTTPFDVVDPVSTTVLTTIESEFLATISKG